VPPQPASSSDGPEQVLGVVGVVGVVVDEDELAVEVGLGALVGLGEEVGLGLLDPLELLEPLARATLRVVRAGAA
jgi:hypothetical protein